MGCANLRYATRTALFKQTVIQLSTTARSKSRGGGHNIDFTALCDLFQAQPPNARIQPPEASATETT
jgi:hypothetical protein